MPPKKKNQTRKGGAGGAKEAPVITDERFSGMHTAPVFRRMKADSHKVELDPRFSAVLSDERFRVPGSKYDKYGRKQGQTDAKAELASFYTLGDGGDDDEEDDDEELELAEAELEASKDASSSAKKKGMKAKPKTMKRQKFKPGEKLPTNEVERRLEHLNRMARGELESGDEEDSSSSSSEDDEEEEDGDEADGLRDDAGGPVQSEITVGGETTRLAVCNLDWDHLGAVDVLRLMESFAPAGGAVLGCKVYPSDYGLERLTHEAQFGPSIDGAVEAAAGEESESEDDGDEESDDDGYEEERVGELEGGKDGGARKKVGVVFAEGDSDDDSDDDNVLDIGAGGFTTRQALGVARKGKNVEVAAGYGKTLDYDEEALRRYELQRTKYYFAVVECGDVATAAALYERVDGLEFEYSSTVFDLSFVPQGVDFSGRTVRDEADCVPDDYQAPEFVSAARQQTKVTCSWDGEDPGRVRALQRLGDLEKVGADADVSDLIALSDEDDEGDNESVSDEDGGGGGGSRKSRSELRKLMGLEDGSDEGSSDSGSDKGFGDGDSDSGSDDGGAGDGFTFVASDPAKEAELRAKLAEKKGRRGGGGDGFGVEETPWEKTQRKLAEKKRERKQARKARLKSMGQDEDDDSSSGDDGGKRDATDAEFFLTADSDDNSEKEEEEGATGGGTAGRRGAQAAAKIPKKGLGAAGPDLDDGGGDDGALGEDEEDEDYDMRAVVRADKMRGKKLKGQRAKKEAKRQAAAGLGDGGDNFQMDVKDERFAAVLDGDARFGLDPTSSAFKATPGMRAVLGEQRKRRQAKAKEQGEHGGDRQGSQEGSQQGPGHGSHIGDAGSGKDGGSGAATMSALVSSLKKRSLPETTKRGSTKPTKKSKKNKAGV